jgi:tetratricopeptide (TPR) repeat protein
MSEETAAAEELAAPDTAGLAIDLAMEEARNHPSLRDDVAAFLRDQRSLIDIQKHHLLKQFALTLWEKRMGVLLRIATAFIGLVVAAGATWLIWNAAHSNDLVIDAFQAPPELADRGLSGPVLAAKLSDKIAAMQAQTNSQRAPKSYASFSEGLKLAIPETGVSLSELDRFLREKLGHDLHIGGEIVVTEKGIALTARVGGDGSATVTGAQTDMDSLLQKLAEQVYRITQPYRFAVWLNAQDRPEEAVAIFKTVATSGPVGERAWAYNGWGAITFQRQGDRFAMSLTRRGRALDPQHYLLAANIAGSETRLGQTEASMRDYETALALMSAHGTDYSMPERIESLQHVYRTHYLRLRGAWQEAAGQNRLAAAGNIGAAGPGVFGSRAEILAALHERTAARAALADVPAVTQSNFVGFQGAFVPRLPVALEAQDWAGALLAERDAAALVALFPGISEDKPALLDSGTALALAHLGQFAAAEARIKATPGDCYPCLRARAQVAALQGQDARADFWFASAVAIAPSSPYAEFEWGQALLARGKPDAAIEEFTLANKKGPHFADPLEGWGEALMAKNQSHRALEKFAEAEKYAPNWGRLHLKWGEALAYSGKKDDAAKQFARAAALDLTPSEKSELAKARPHV